ncbi:MAG: prephenate dehydratase [Cyanobacteria bacterium P01_A01_bin.123]
MPCSIAHLGPKGTYSEAAAIAYARWLNHQGIVASLEAYPTIAQALQATTDGVSHYAVVPIENSIQGGVTITLDTLWQLDTLSIHHALILPISNALLSRAQNLKQIKRVYSHSQALSQCQNWLNQTLPTVEIVPTHSTTEALAWLPDELSSAAIASQWAAEIYQLPVLAYSINDHADNCTKFLSLSLDRSEVGDYTSLAFSLPINAPGALLKPLQIFSTLDINLSRIESRPTKRSFGEYLFFIDLEASLQDPSTQLALSTLKTCTETLKIFGSYKTIPIDWQTLR